MKSKPIGSFGSNLPGLVLLATILTLPAATVRYVDANSSNPVPPFTEWATAAREIQAAVDAASAGDDILVTNGVYASGTRDVYGMPNRVAVIKPVTIRSINGPTVTTIAGSYAGDYRAVRCVYLTNGATLSGFTVEGGRTWPTGEDYRKRTGGGIWCESTSAVVSNCVLGGNEAALGGGGGYGGTFNNCILTNNYASSGGGASEGILNNCLLSANSAGVGGGAEFSALNNCTVVGNLALGQFSSGGGARGCSLNNCILYYNSSGGTLDGNNYTFLWIPATNCCTTPLPAGSGNFTNAPLFVHTNGWSNLRLQTGSACIDTGNNAYSPGLTDLDGNPRIIGANVDVGAYEYTPPPAPPTILSQPTDQTVRVGAAAVFAVTASGTAPLSYSWQRDGMFLVDGTNTAYIASNVQLTDSGSRFSCLVSNAYGSVTSSVAVLTVVTNGGGSCGGEDFNAPTVDSVRWGPDFHLGSGGQLLQTNGALRFQGGDLVIRPWICSYGSYTQDWEVIADVNVGNVALTQDETYARVFLGIADHHDLPIQNGWPGDTFSIALNVFYETPGSVARVFESVVQSNGVVVDHLQGTANTTNEHASLRITFNATSKTLTAWYDVSGNTDVHNWVALSSVGIDGADVDWAMTGESAFRFSLGASSRDYTVSASDHVWADNFQLVGSLSQSSLRFCCASVSNNVFETRLDGPLGAAVVVDTSFDLAAWSPWQTNTLPAGGLLLAKPMGTDRVYMRARIP